MSVFSDTKANPTASRTALLGITTPLSGVSVPGTSAGTMIAIVSIRLGVLTADPSAGTLVRGNGSNLLWISGTTAQVNGKLATLTYAGATAGTDDLSVVILGADGALVPAGQVPIVIVPLIDGPNELGSLLSYNAGTITLESRTLDGPDLALQEPDGSQNAIACVLINSTIGVRSHLSVTNANISGSIVPRIAVAGRVEIDGSMTFTGNGSTVSLAQGATLVNQGAFSIDAHAAQFTGSGTLINNGVILVTGNGSAGAPTRIDTSLDGTGVISLVGGVSVEIGARVGADETVRLGAGANTLHLSQPATFAGQIAGFSRGDMLVLDNAIVTSALGSRSADTDGTAITLFNGTSIVGTIRFSGPEAGTTFQLGADTSGNATLALAPAMTPTASTNVDVFRFFDAAHGSQLLTGDPVERDAIIGSRPDLQYEGVGLHALDPAQQDSNTTAVYRFFDVSTGTHFMTASTAERDMLRGNRPDLVLEPGSTLFEHATAEAGDRAVYRFFDNRTGAHFFTADPGERATILSNRPDLTLEGVAFYAPTR